MAQTRSTSLWRPGNALAALGIFILRTCARLPLPWLQAIGKALGSVLGAVFPYRRHVALTNLRLCFPEMNEKECRRLLYKHYQAMGMGVFEMAAGWWKDEKELLAHSEVTGLENLQAVLDSGRGALMLTAHFTTLEIAGRILNAHHRMSCLFRRPNQPYIAKVMQERREHILNQAIHFDDMKPFIAALRSGEFIWFAPDQGRRSKESALVPFFGIPAVTNTATGRIARMGRAAILPFVGYRLPDGRYRVEVLPEMKDLPTKDPEADTLAINRVIESFVRKAPDQYFWLHRRFKRRGPDHEDVYAG